MAEEYKIFTVDNGQMKEVNVSVYNTKVIRKELSNLETKLANLQDELKEIMVEHFLQDKIAPPRGNLREMAQEKMLSKSIFSFDEIREELGKECGTSYTKAAYYNASKTAIANLEADEKIRKLEDGRYVNLVKEEKEEIVHSQSEG